MSGERRSAVLVGGLLVAVACCVLMGWLTNQVIAGEVSTFDAAVRERVHGQWLWSKPLMLTCTVVGGPTFLGVASLVLFVALWRRRMRHQDGLLVAAMAGGMVLAVVLKEYFHRPRPTPFYDLPQPLTWSYPSGHALASVCFFTALAMVLSPFTSGLRRIALWVSCIAMIALVGLSRAWLGVHWPSDVLGGWLMGGVWMSFVWVAFEHLGRDSAASPQEPRL